MKIKSRDEEWELDADRPEGGIFDFEMVTAGLSCTRTSTRTA